MKAQHQSLDRISTLPQDTMEKVLSLMPIRDALRTSILSKKWRYCWTGMPTLVFDDKIVKLSSNVEKEIVKYKLVNAIFHVLLLHKGPISELNIFISNAEIANEIDQIILHLSWSKNIKKFYFGIYKSYKLPFSFFSLQGLECLELLFCKIEIPLMFNGFSMLKYLRFYDVKITAKMLQQFLTACPLLEGITFTGNHRTDFTGGDKFTFVELFKCLPLIQGVKFSRVYIKHFTAGGMSQKLPTSLVYLRILFLDQVCFHKHDELSSILCVINSSPNLENIKLKMIRPDRQYTVLDPQEYLDLNMAHLKELEIISFHNYTPEMEFVKLVMAKSPMLQKARIELNTSVSDHEEVKMLRDLLFMPIPRASPAAKFIIERPKK
ncbi:F-box/FBD/LRR-repeat protein At1g13570 [Lactuca sativa]|nr:F-box/FBD/LRR-repeat protein At1g13570 [Lactuca sativa]